MRLLGSAVFRGLIRLGAGEASSVGDESVRRLFRSRLPIVSVLRFPVEARVEAVGAELSVSAQQQHISTICQGGMTVCLATPNFLSRC